MIERLCIIGTGLIGGSLARGLRAAGQVKTIVGCSRNEKNLQQAVALGVIDEFSLDVVAAVTNADVIVIAVPVGAIGSIFEKIKGHIKADAVITDVGSTKSSVVDAAKAVFGVAPSGFVPGHPIAGTEKSGIESSFAELFIDRRVILTPLDSSRPDAIETVRNMWQACGAQVVELGVEHHDEVLAATSHLPHILAYALVDTLARMHEHQEIFNFAAGGFRDFTRIASSDPLMWHDICLANRDALLVMLRRFSNDLKETFIRAKQARDENC
jgi:prephenate dehydrogenase